MVMMIRSTLRANRMASMATRAMALPMRSFSSSIVRSQENPIKATETATQQPPLSAEPEQGLEFESVEKFEQVQKSIDPESAIDNIIRGKPFEDVAASAPEVSKDLESTLNAEFKSLISDFVTNADLTSAFPQLNPAKDIAGARSPGSQRSGYVLKKNRYNKANFPNIRPSGEEEPYSPQELFLRRQHQAKVLGELGSNITNVYRPHEDVLNPPSAAKTSIETLLAAGVHLGHAVEFHRASTQPYIYGIRDGIHIIDLESTVVHLRRAARVAQGVAEQGGIILYVGTRPGQQRALEEAAERSGGYYVHKRWVAGTLTNCRVVSEQWGRMEVDMGDNGTGRMLSPNLKRALVKPDLVVILNPVENRNAIYECIQYKIPTIGIVDTNSEPSLLTYPIPGNDDSIRSTDLIVGVISKAAQRGLKSRYQMFNDRKKAKKAEEAAATAAQSSKPNDQTLLQA